MSIRFETRPTSPLVKAAMFVGLAVTGGVLGYSVARITDFRAGVVGWDDALAIIMGCVLLLLAVTSAITTLVRPSAIPNGSGLLQTLVFALAGLMFLAPMYPSGGIGPEWVFAGIVAAFILQTVANVLVWRRADEMLRRLMTDTSTIAFWGLQSAFFLYAAAERLDLIAPVSAWGMAGILMVVYLVSSIVPSMRRGLT